MVREHANANSGARIALSNEVNPATIDDKVGCLRKTAATQQVTQPCVIPNARSDQVRQRAAEATSTTAPG